MQEALALLVLAPLLTLTLVALFTVMGVLFPRQISGVRSTAAAMPGRSTLLGFVNVLFLLIIAAALSAIGEGGGGGGLFQVLALILFVLLIAALAFGLAGMAPLIGERLLPEANATRQSTWGGAAMVVASLTPFVGWFLLFPYLSFRGLGAFVISLFTESSN